MADANDDDKPFTSNTSMKVYNYMYIYAYVYVRSYTIESYYMYT